VMKPTIISRINAQIKSKTIIITKSMYFQLRAKLPDLKPSKISFTLIFSCLVPSLKD
jgi:hypothetical protein